jgi:tetratricopeptide (TPR) repeat protein
MVLGTPAYMAPEQAAGQSKVVGPPADVYALGVILYELLVGRPPFQADTPLDLLLRVRTEEPVPPGWLRARVPRDLETICLKCLEKEPARRYASALHLAEDLQRFLAGEPVRARPVGRLARTWRWCLRNPVVTVLLVVVALSLLAGTGVSSGFAVYAFRQAEQARRQRVAAEQEARRADQTSLLALVALTDLSTRIYQDQRLREHDQGVLLRELLKSAVRIFGKLIALNNANPAVESERGQALGQLAQVTAAMGLPSEALELFGLVETVFEKLSSAQPAEANHRKHRAITCQNLGNVYRGMHRWPEAVQVYGRARDLWADLVRTYPDNTRYTLGRAEATCRLGAVLLEKGDAESGLDTLTKATADAETVVRQAPNEGETLYGAAGVYALATAAALGDANLLPGDREQRGKQYGSRALELLSKARGVGYFNNPEHVRRLKRDKDLAPLRSRADFQKLLSTLEAR